MLQYFFLHVKNDMFLIIYEYIKWDKGVYKKHGLLKNKKGQILCMKLF